jgi:hypothetical protein
LIALNHRWSRELKIFFILPPQQYAVGSPLDSYTEVRFK